MALETTLWDPAEHLDSEAAIVAYLEAALEDGDPSVLSFVLDDIALPCGRIRVRSGGSPGGHNGLKDIERALGTNQYPRLRIGVDAPPPRISQVDYVLGRFTDPQRESLAPAITRATLALETWVEKGIESAMSVFNADDRGDDKLKG